MEAEQNIINDGLILKKKYNKRGSPKGLSKNDKHQFYMLNFPEYRENNYNYQKTKALCECGCVVSKRNLSVHRESYKHDVCLMKKDNIHTQIQQSIYI